MLTSSDLRQPALRLPGMYSLWLSSSVVNVVFLYSESGLSPIRLDGISPGVGAIVSAQAAAAQKGFVCLSRMASAIVLMTQHWDPRGYSPSSLSKASIPIISSSISSSLCSLSLCQGSTGCGCLLQLLIWSPYF